MMHFAEYMSVFRDTQPDHNAWENARWFMDLPAVFVAKELVPVSLVSPIPD